MKQLFLRLTVTFWLLFLSLVISIGISFYFEYEQIFSQKIINIDQHTTNIGEKVSLDLERITELYEMFTAVSDTNFKKTILLYETLSDAELARLINSEEGMSQNREEIVQQLARRHALEEMGIHFFQLANIMESAKLSFLTLEEGAEFFEKTSLEKLTEGYEDSVVYFEYINDMGKEGYKFFLIREAQLGDEMIGYLVAELVSTTHVLLDLTNSLYFVQGNAHIPCCELFTTEEREFLEKSTLQEASEFFKDRGFHSSMYISEQSGIKILHYTSLNQIHREVFAETLTIFKISVVLSVILFAIGFYLLFKSVIKPCYLLVDYVRRCGVRDYLLPSNLNNRWKATFLSVREAYLENERLLAEKDNQSEELQVAWKRAIDASQAKTHFLAKVSHELKTPLNAIKGYAQLLRWTVKGDKQQQQIEIIDHSSELLLKLVNELLDFSVIEAGRIKLQIDEINVVNLSQEIEELFVIQASSKNLDFFVTVDETIPTKLYGDANRIKQVIINLTSNAIKFTESGYIIVNIELDYQNETDAFISIKVKDTGKGIEESKFSTVFESFTQENNSISRHFGGTGLGLSISKQLAETMGGNLTLESKVDVGSTFTFFLPLSKYPIEEGKQ